MLSDREIIESLRDFVGPDIEPVPMMSDEEINESLRDFLGRDVQTQVLVDAVVDAVDDKMQVIVDAVVDAMDIKIQAGAYVLYTKIGDEFEKLHRRLSNASDEVHGVRVQVDEVYRRVDGLRDEIDLVQLVSTTALMVLCCVLVGVMNMEALIKLQVFKDGQPLSFEEQRPVEQMATDRVFTNRSDVEVMCDGCIYVMQMVGSYLVLGLFME